MVSLRQKDMLYKIGLLILLILSNFLNYLIFSMTKNASYEQLCSLISEVAACSSTRSANFNVKNIDFQVPFETYNNNVTLCRQMTLSKTSGEFYNFRAMFNANETNFIVFDGFEDKTISLLLSLSPQHLAPYTSSIVITN